MVMKPVVVVSDSRPKFREEYCPVCKVDELHAIVYRHEPGREDEIESLYCMMCQNKQVVS